MLAIAALVAAVAVVAAVLLRGNGDDYVVYAEFQNASQLVRGNEVRIAGSQIGSVEDIELTNNGGAQVKLKITEEGYAPLKTGTRAVIRLTSLSGVANRYIDLQLAGPFGAGDRLFLGGPIKSGLPGQGYQLGLTPAELYRTSLRAIGEQLLHRGFDFAGAPAEEQDAVLSELEAGRLDLGGFSSAIFFETLLANTIEGYFADPAYGGNRDMVSWRMVGFPGAYAAYLGVYTQHGIRFDREPLSMAHSHAHP